jgi:two-component system chemotaxis response regulator CheY
MPTKRVLSLGQCGADHASISWVLESGCGAEVIPAATADEALTLLRDGDFDLVLVNRVLDYDGDSGVDFIARLKADEALQAVPVMLVSNYEDAQEQAVKGGALPGFGKSSLRHPQTVARLKEVLAAARPPRPGEEQ